MNERIHGQIKQSLQAAETLYHRLVLLVGGIGSGKTAALHDVADEFATSAINLNLALSTRLLELTEKQRALRLSGFLDQIVEQAGSLVVLDNLEILFDRSLKQDPLRLLQGISRNRTVLASWNGDWVDGRLTYAASNHPEFRTYETVDAQIVVVTGSAINDKLINTKKEAGQV